MPRHAFTRQVSTRAVNYSPVSLSGEVVLANGAITVTLPTPSADNVGSTYTVKNVGTGTVTVNATSGTIDGVTAFTMTVRYSSVDFINDGTNWFTV